MDHVTKDWSNDAENSDFHCRNKLHFKIYHNRKQLFLNGKIVIFLTLTVFTEGLVSIRDFFKKKKKTKGEKLDYNFFVCTTN